MLLNLSPAVLSVQRSTTLCASSRNIDHEPRSPKVSSWKRSSLYWSSSASRSNVSRCQPITASTSVLLSSNFDVHLTALSKTRPLNSVEVLLTRPKTPGARPLAGTPTIDAWPWCSGASAKLSLPRVLYDDDELVTTRESTGSVM